MVAGAAGAGDCATAALATAATTAMTAERRKASNNVTGMSSKIFSGEILADLIWVLQKQYYLYSLLPLSCADDLQLVRLVGEYDAAAQNNSCPGRESLNVSSSGEINNMKYFKTDVQKDNRDVNRIFCMT